MDVVGFGALNLDRLYKVERIALEGEHVPVESVTESPGGSSANTIAGLAGMGMKTGFIGAVGRDPEGGLMLDDFRRRGVDTSGIRTLEGRTGIIIGFVDSKGERTLYPYPGANSLLSEKDVDIGYVRKAGFIHLTSFVGNDQFQLQKKLVKGLTGTKISVAPGDLYTKKGLSALRPIIKRSTVLFLNDSEIRSLTGESYRKGSRTLMDEGAKIVAVTLGKRGCFVLDESGGLEIPARKVNAIDSTGAGDAFAAGFLYTLTKGGPILEAGRNGNRVASLCVRTKGARNWIKKKK